MKDRIVHRARNLTPRGSEQGEIGEPKDTVMSVRRDTIPHQNSVDEIGLEHPVLPPVPTRGNRSVALRVEGFPRDAFNLVDTHSFSNACRRSSRPLSNVDRNTVEVIHFDRSRTRGSPVHVRRHLTIRGR